MHEPIVGNVRLAPPPAPFDPPRGDAVFAQDFAPLDDAPPRRREHGFKLLGASFGFIQGLLSL